MRKPVSRLAAAFTPHSHPARIRRRASNTNTSAVVPSSTWRPGTFIGRWCSGAASRRLAKPLLGDWSTTVMSQEPYCSSRRVFWIVDNGSSHRVERAAEELRACHPRIVMVHTPVDASWLNQIENSLLDHPAQGAH